MYDKRSLKFAYKYVHDEKKYHDQFNACVTHTHNCALMTEEDFSKIVAAYDDESESKGENEFDVRNADIRKHFLNPKVGSSPSHPLSQYDSFE